MKYTNLTCLSLIAVFGISSIAEAQIRNSPIQRSKIKREDPKKSNLAKEDGVVYLEEFLDEDVPVTITKAAPAYITLKGERVIGTIVGNQKAVLLAVSDRAYRVRAQAHHGQVAGWISKAAVDGLPKDFDENVKKFAERYAVVSELIRNGQIALGMTQAEVCESIGDPNKRSSKVDKTGRKDILEYITYDRIPQSTVAQDQFGRPFQTTTYLTVETGRVKVEFENDMVASIEESEGTELGRGGIKIVPPPIFLFRRF